MTFIDWILIFLLLAFIFSGFKGGFIYSFGSFIGVILGVFMAGRFYESLAHLFGNDTNWANVLCFLLIFVVVSRLVGLIFYIINKVFKIMTIIPFLGLINRLGGVIFGFIEGTLFLGVFIFFLSRFALADKITELLGGSALTPFFIKIGRLLSFLLPEMIQQLKSIV